MPLSDPTVEDFKKPLGITELLNYRCKQDRQSCLSCLRSISVSRLLEVLWAYCFNGRAGMTASWSLGRRRIDLDHVVQPGDDPQSFADLLSRHAHHGGGGAGILEDNGVGTDAGTRSDVDIAKDFSGGADDDMVT